MVSLPHLVDLTILADPPVHSILLNHLVIPTQAPLTLRFKVDGDGPPLQDFLPKKLENLKNIRSVTSVNLLFDGVGRFMRLEGPIGGLYVFGHWKDLASFDSDRRVFKFLNHRDFALSGAQRLVITKFKHPMVARIKESASYLIFLRMKALRTLTLIQCNNLPFILALNPDQNPLKHIICPKLEEVVLYVEKRESFNISALITMAKERASRRKKLPSITIISLGELVPGREVFKLGEYVTSVVYRVMEEPPAWDSIPEDGDC